jgi:hypothetical protein
MKTIQQKGENRHGQVFVHPSHLCQIGESDQGLICKLSTRILVDVGKALLRFASHNLPPSAFTNAATSGLRSMTFRFHPSWNSRWYASSPGSF